MRLAFAAAAVLCLAASPALGAGAAKSSEPKPAPHLDLNAFAAPIVHEGRLVNYVFVSVRLNAAEGGDAAALKKLEPHIRDAVVRVAHRRSLNVAGDLTQVDAARLSAVALAEGRRIGGAKTFTSAEVRKQTPQHRRVRVPGAHKPA